MELSQSFLLLVKQRVLCGLAVAECSEGAVICLRPCVKRQSRFSMLPSSLQRH